MKAVEIEIDGQHNENLRFRPLQRSIRGRFDFMRMGEPMAKVHAQNWPQAIPSQRLGIDADGVGYVEETLHRDEFAALREKIEHQGFKLEPKVARFEGVHLPSWYYWIQRAVKCGLAKVTKGEVPTKIDGEPIKNFILAKPEPSSTDKLTAAIERQSELFEQLLNKLAEAK